MNKNHTYSKLRNMFTGVKNWVNYEANNIKRGWQSSNISKIKLILNYLSFLASLALLVLGATAFPFTAISTSILVILLPSLSILSGTLMFYIVGENLYKDAKNQNSLKLPSTKLIGGSLLISFGLLHLLSVLKIFIIPIYVSLPLLFVGPIFTIYRIESDQATYKLSDNVKAARAIFYSAIILTLYIGIFFTLVPIIPIVLPPVVSIIIKPALILALAVAHPALESVAEYNKELANMKKQVDLKNIEQELDKGTKISEEDLTQNEKEKLLSVENKQASPIKTAKLEIEPLIKKKKTGEILSDNNGETMESVKENFSKRVHIHKTHTELAKEKEKEELEK